MNNPLIEYLPLRTLVLVWLVYPRPRTLTMIQLSYYEIVLNDLAGILPVNQKGWRGLVVRLIHAWITTEKTALDKLFKAGIVMVGELPK